MAEEKTRVKECKSFAEFLSEIKGRGGRVRNVKLLHEGLVEPSHKGGGIVAQPKVRVVLSTIDPQGTDAKAELIRWSEKFDVGTVTIYPSGTGTHRDPQALNKIAEYRNQLEREQFVVLEGEWTPKDLAA